PTQFRELNLPLVGKVPVAQQLMVAAAIAGTKFPAYITLDMEDRDKAARLLEQLSAKIFLQKGNLLGLPTTLDAYRLPDYQKHVLYVLSYQMHAFKVRLYVALVGNQLVAATKPEILREIIDVSTVPPAAKPNPAHLLLRLNQRALNRLAPDVQLFWEEKARLACHRNTISIYNLLKLYEAPVQEIPRLAEAKYGVRSFCPDHGAYQSDDRHDRGICG